MTHKLHKEKVLDLLKGGGWVCVEDMTKLFIVDYRRRLVDIQRMGYELESRRCTQHEYHGGGSKEWRLVDVPKKKVQVVEHLSNGSVRVTYQEV